ncbi:MAG TPA: folylpolyglutamate synthase/dihydrofolate synthase family protein [Pyrinomonadaceae bacterium]|jgi:dihydrofolate synthase/folylpolyglutamate synthase
MNFEETLSYLLSLGHETLAIKLGLRNTELLLESLSSPQKSFASVQIAGTNGKGSTAAMLDSISNAAGILTGLYTSPHLVSITERIRIGGKEITEVDFAKYATLVRKAAEELLADGILEALPTFFEQVTAIALLAFREAGVSLAILETGLGGRLDATTVAGATTVAITPLALDHQEYLGETLVEIAAEKAAIIRPGVIAIIAPQPQPALDVILRRCAECQVRPSVDECDSKIEDVTDEGRFTVTFATGAADGRYENVVLGLLGEHQIGNVAVAIRLAESLRQRGFGISKANIVKGVETARHPGRLELHGGQPSLLLDGSHNPSGAQALRKYLDAFVKVPLTLVFGAMNDKRLEEIAGILFPVADRLVLTRPNNPRAATVDKLQDLARDVLEPNKIIPTRSPAEAMQKAGECTPADGLICATGSLYLVGEVKALIETQELSEVVTRV